MSKSSLSSSDAIRVSRLSRIHILIADNDEYICLLIKDVLRNLGFQSVVTVKDGQEAIDVIRKQPIDLVITDWQMDPMDGRDFVTFIRTDAQSPNKFLPIIMLTGNGEISDIQTARDVGVTEYVIKPFTAKALCDRICLVIENPRKFIVSTVFNGPDRRRKQVPIAGDKERRKAG